MTGFLTTESRQKLEKISVKSGKRVYLFCWWQICEIVSLLSRKEKRQSKEQFS